MWKKVCIGLSRDEWLFKWPGKSSLLSFFGASFHRLRLCLKLCLQPLESIHLFLFDQFPSINLFLFISSYLRATPRHLLRRCALVSPQVASVHSTAWIGAFKAGRLQVACIPFLVDGQPQVEEHCMDVRALGCGGRFEGLKKWYDVAGFNIENKTYKDCCICLVFLDSFCSILPNG